MSLQTQRPFINETTSTTATPIPAFEHAFVSFEIFFECCNPRLLFSRQTPLHRSSLEGHVDVCQFLVTCNADVNAKDNEYDSHP
jgi:hypothetical protein